MENMYVEQGPLGLNQEDFLDEDVLEIIRCIKIAFEPIDLGRMRENKQKLLSY